jgi:hypothetical protein
VRLLASSISGWLRLGIGSLLGRAAPAFGASARNQLGLSAGGFDNFPEIDAVNNLGLDQSAGDGLE